MFGFKRLCQVTWLAITASLVVLHVIYKRPLTNAIDAGTFLALIALFVRALVDVWRWADLSARKVWLWIQNSSVNWKLEVRASASKPIEDADIELLCQALLKLGSFGNITRSNGSDTITARTGQGYSIAVQPLQSGLNSSWIVRFDAVHIGYRDAIYTLQRVFVPVADQITEQIEGLAEKIYTIEARFTGTNPYAAVLLNELKAKSTDRVLVTLKQDGSTVQVTKNTIVSSSNSQADAIQVMSTVFGLSLRGAF